MLGGVCETELLSMKDVITKLHVLKIISSKQDVKIQVSCLVSRHVTGLKAAMINISEFCLT